MPRGTAATHGRSRRRSATFGSSRRRERFGAGRMPRDKDVTYYTITDRRFFVGTVALLNSLRLTDNEGELVVLDLGLTEDQRSRLRAHATLVPPPPGLRRPQFKSFPTMLDPSGVLVVIDSDMIVTRAFHDVTAEAARGRICVFP